MNSSTQRLTKAQQRVLDYLLADESGDYIDVPRSVCNVHGPFDFLVSRNLIQEEWVKAELPPGSYKMVYRAVRP